MECMVKLSSYEILTYQYETRHNDEEELTIKCLKSLMNNKTGLVAVLDSVDSITLISLSLYSPSHRTRALVLEILAAVCLIPGGHSLVIRGLEDAFESRPRFERVVRVLEDCWRGLSHAEKDLQVSLF